MKKEDHTIGNLLAEHLKKDPQVMFAAYKSMFPFLNGGMRANTDGS